MTRLLYAVTGMTTKLIPCIEKLRQCEWFAAVGSPMSNPDLIAVRSWSEAETHFKSQEWEATQLLAYNDSRERLHANYPGRSAKAWNMINKEIKALMEPLVEEKVRPVAEREGLSPQFEACVKWDLLGYCRELEYGNTADAFFLRLVDIYTSGHFPCGWNGKYPNGWLVVY